MVSRSIFVTCLAVAGLFLAVFGVGSYLLRSDELTGRENHDGIDDSQSNLPVTTDTRSNDEPNASGQRAETELVSKGERAIRIEAEGEPRLDPSKSTAPELQRSADDRASQLIHLYEQDGVRLSYRVESYMSNQEADPDWAKAAGREIEQWLSEGIPEDTARRDVQCISDVCYIDLFVPSEQFVRAYWPQFRQWRSEHPQGFLRPLFYVKAGDEFYRTYVFRDTFDPDDL